MVASERPDRILIAFHDPSLVANAGLLLPVTLAHRLDLHELMDSHLDLGDAPGRVNTGDKLTTLVASALAGGDCIDNVDALRASRTGRVLACAVKAPSTLGTRAPVGQGKPGTACACLERRSGPRGRAAGHRPRLQRLRDLQTGQGGSALSQLHL